MDQPLDTIVRGTVTTSGICAFATGLYCITKRSPQYALMAIAAGANSGLTACSFFALREVVVSPLLVNTLSWSQYSRRRHDLGISHPDDAPTEPPTLSDLRKHNTLDSGLSGAIAGGALRGWKSGRQAILPGMLFFGAACTLLQLIYNEATITRLRYISGLKINAPPNETHATPGTQSKTVSERFLNMIGIHQVTEEEYLEKMKATRDRHLRRIEELEQQLAAEQVQEESKK